MPMPSLACGARRQPTSNQVAGLRYLLAAMWGVSVGNGATAGTNPRRRPIRIARD